MICKMRILGKNRAMQISAEGVLVYGTLKHALLVAKPYDYVSGGSAPSRKSARYGSRIRPRLLA
jgi:hypothetical protein